MHLKRRLLSKLLIGLFYTSFVVTLGLCFNNCQATHDLASADSASILSAGETLTADPTLESQAVSILNTYCIACHGGAPGNGGVHNITDKNSLFLQGLIVPGKGTQGILVSAISPGGLMPPGMTLSSQDVQTIENWIGSMKIVPSAVGSSANGSTGTSGSSTSGTSGSSGSTGTTINADPTLASQAQSILTTYCGSCHISTAAGGISNIDNANSLYAQGLIVPGQGTQGSLIAAVSPGGNMPLGNPGSMSSQDLTTIENWINSMQVVAGSSGSAPAVPPPPPLTDTYQSLNANVFVPYCVYCHGPNSSQGDGLRLDTYQSVYNSRGDVLEKCLSGSMPRGGPPLTTAELTALQDWINAGAPND